MPVRDSDSPGDKPPHVLARDRYEEIVPNAVLCTGEYPAADSPRPIVFGLQPGVGLVLLDVEDLEESERAAEATKALTGSQALLAALGTTALSAGAIWLARRRARRGTAAIRDAVEQTRGADAAPAASVGFGVGEPAVRAHPRAGAGAGPATAYRRGRSGFPGARGPARRRLPGCRRLDRLRQPASVRWWHSAPPSGTVDHPDTGAVPARDPDGLDAAHPLGRYPTRAVGTIPVPVRVAVGGVEPVGRDGRIRAAARALARSRSGRSTRRPRRTPAPPGRVPQRRRRAGRGPRRRPHRQHRPAVARRRAAPPGQRLAGGPGRVATPRPAVAAYGDAGTPGSQRRRPHRGGHTGAGGGPAQADRVRVSRDRDRPGAVAVHIRRERRDPARPARHRGGDQP